MDDATKLLGYEPMKLLGYEAIRPHGHMAVNTEVHSEISNLVRNSESIRTFPSSTLRNQQMPAIAPVALDPTSLVALEAPSSVVGLPAGWLGGKHKPEGGWEDRTI